MNTPGRATTIALLMSPMLGACGGQTPPPETRSVIVYSGVRLQPDAERMAEVESWLRPQLEEIQTNPGFLIRMIREDETRYPWDGLEIYGDTADIHLQTTAADAETPYQIYAHLRLVQDYGTLEEWAPEAAGLEGLEAEEAILTRVADVWLLGRSVFDTQPFGPMDELLYSSEYGYLEDFILATQGDRFAEERERYLEERPERAEEFEEWLEATFERTEPGYLADSDDELVSGDSVRAD